MIRSVAKWTSLAAAAACVVGLAAPAQAQETKIVLGMSGWTGFAPLTLADKAGIFKKNGLNVELRMIPQKDRHLALASGAALPFADRSFDLVLTSAVILHNPPAVAEQIRREVIRVARHWVAHNEDTDVTYNRFGYDTAAWYRSVGIPLAESGPIPVDGPRSPSQFCVAVPWPS